MEIKNSAATTAGREDFEFHSVGSRTLRCLLPSGHIWSEGKPVVLTRNRRLYFRGQDMNKRSVEIWLAATALGAMVPLGSGFAADLPVKAKPIVAAAFDWSGVYVGMHAGYGGGMKNWETAGTGGSFVARGPLVGGQIGINKQLGSLVVGVELEGSWADIRGAQRLVLGGPAVPFAQTQNERSGIDGIA